MPFHHWTLPHILLLNLFAVLKWHVLNDSHPHCAKSCTSLHQLAPARSEAQLLTFQEWGCRVEVIVSIMRLRQELILGEDGY